MIDVSKISDILNNSPSVELLKLRNRDAIIIFLINTFSNQKTTISSEAIHAQLVDYLEFRLIENDEENEVEVIDTYEIKAKKFIQHWTNKGFLTNYQDERGDIFYELSSHSNKTIDWLTSLKKEEYVGTESKFKNIFNQLQELVEFSSDDAEKRIQLLEDKKLEIEQQIQRIKIGDDVKVFEEPRCSRFIISYLDRRICDPILYLFPLLIEVCNFNPAPDGSRMSDWIFF